jgi:TonB-dependent receptor
MTKHSFGRTEKHALPRSSSIARLAILAMAMSAAVPSASLFAQNASVGTVSGRVLNASTAKYLGKAVVTVEGTNLEVLTDDYGYFELRDVPAGKVKVKITYTGLAPVTEELVVTSDKTINKDFKLARARLSSDKDKDVIALDEFVVSTDRFSNAAEIAINEERYAPNIKNVVSAEAFGDIPDGNIGEFVKYIPGVQIGYGYEGSGMSAADNNATSISVRGFGPEMTNITIDGVPVTNASPATLTRAIGLDMQSINNASRVEVIKVPTPDMPSNSPGGAINLITKSAFEYSKPSLSWKLSMNINSEDFGSDMFNKTPGPANKATRKTLPGAEFTYVIPVNSKFGFAFTGAWSKVFNENHRAQSDWNYELSDINSSSTYKLDLTPGGGPNIDVTGKTGNSTVFKSVNGKTLDISNPLFYRFSVTDTPNTVERKSGSFKFDWRPNHYHKITIGYTLGLFDTVDAQRRLQFYANKGYTADWGADFATSYTFIPKGTVVNGAALKSDFNPNPQVNQTVTTRDRTANSHTGYIDYVFAYGPWKIDANVNGSRSRGSYTDMDNGHFSELETSISGGKMSFLGLNEGIPSSIQFLDKTGTPITWGTLSNWKSPSISAKSGETESQDNTFNAKVNVRRDLDFLPWDWITMSAKTGFYREQQTVKKWGLGSGYKMSYVGPALALSDYLDDGYIDVEPGFNLPTQQWVSTYKLFQLYKDNPSYFNADSDSDKANNYTNWANQQKKLTETSDQAYFMIDGRTLRNRLSYVIGVRQEWATREGYATKTDGTWNYVKNKDGTLYRSTLYPTGVKIDSTSSKLFDTSATGQALRADLDSKGITYPTAVVANNSYAMKLLNLQPFSSMDGKITGKPTYSASFAYDIFKDLTARLSWNRSQARPDFENGILVQGGGYKFSEFESPDANGYDGSIAVPNPDLKPWQADSYDLQLSYYTPLSGKLSVGTFLKDVKNFQETQTFSWDSETFKEVLANQNFDPSHYEGYYMTTTVNGIGTSRTRGYEIEFSQNLGVLGRFAKWLYVFGSYSHHKIEEHSTNLLSVKPTAGTTMSGGISIEKKDRFSILLRGLYLEEKYLTEPRTFKYNDQSIIVAKYNPSQTNLDVVVRVNITKTYSFFFNARNILNNSLDVIRYDKTGILPSYAYHVDRKKFGVNMVFGITAIY